MSKLEQKIKKKIKDKEEKLVNLKKAHEEVMKQDSKDFEEDFKEDLKFFNSINPFYKQKCKPGKSTILIIVETMLQASIESEIEDLKELLV